ncbi:MAG: ribosome maturation factor RimP [Thioalkalivibrionaceae bacterium]
MAESSNDQFDPDAVVRGRRVHETESGLAPRQAIGERSTQRVALEALADVASRSCGVDLWGVEYRPHARPALLRVFIDHVDGIDVDQCAAVSEQLSLMLDVDAPISGAYTLEVSSPGLERPFFFVDQLADRCGESMVVRLGWADEGRRKLRGKLVEIDAQGGRLTIDEVAIGVCEIDIAAIAQIKLAIESWAEVLREGKNRGRNGDSANRPLREGDSTDAV